MPVPSLASPWLGALISFALLHDGSVTHVTEVSLGGARFDAGGARHGAVHVSLTRLGRDALAPMDGAASPVRVADEVRFRRAPGIVEWWRSTPAGLEQGVTLDRRPEGSGPLRLHMSVGDGVAATGTEAITLGDGDGRTLATYSGLHVLDARGAEVPARMVGAGDHIRIVVDDHDAAYPLVVDPLVYFVDEGPLSPAGSELALDGDGSRAIAGAPGGAGRADVFTRSGTSWTHEATLPAPTLGATAAFGTDVGITRDGTRAIVGAPGADRAFIFRRDASSWTLEATLSTTGATPTLAFGRGVAISGAGDVAVVGAPSDGGTGAGTGTARVFTRSSTTWTERATLVPVLRSSVTQFGASASLSQDGTRVLITPLGTGAPRVFTGAGASWTEEGVLPSPSTFLGSWGHMSADGERVCLYALLTPRSALIVHRTGALWSEEAMVTPSAPPGSMYHDIGGCSLSTDGTRALFSSSGPPGTGPGRTQVFVRSGATWVEEGAYSEGVSDWDQFGRSSAMSADGLHALIGGGATGVRGLALRPTDPDGTPCTLGTTCASGFCTDGVCCATACSGGTNDCRACSAALTGGVSGTCASLSPTVAPTVTCRAASGDCDVPDRCVSGILGCQQMFAPATQVCRPAADGGCDAPDHCTGTDATCPTDAPATNGTICRASAGPCDVDELCDGTAFDCPPDGRVPSGVVCRATMGPCDQPESCTGLVDCPGDSFLNASTVCDTVNGPCDAEDRCSGLSAACTDTFDVGSTCRAPSGPCDVPETCDGTGITCPTDAFAARDTVCAAASGEICDAPDVCTGTSGDCMPTFLEGVECRASTGGCDPAEVCTGAAARCPDDQISLAGTVCRASIDACDPAESCDGENTSCPPEVNDCEPPDDAGTVDAGTTDAGTAPSAAASCACAVAPRAPIQWGLALPVGVAISAVAARRRRESRRSSGCSARASEGR